MLLQGKVAVVSGIGPGMGRSIALQLARNGADVCLGARRQGPLEEVAAEVEALGQHAVWRSTDITVDEHCHHLAEAAMERFGRIDVLVNSAFHPGLSAGSPYAHDPDGQPVTWTPFLESDLDGVWRDTMDVNFFGTLRLTKACVPYLAESGDGRIIMINSQSSMWIKPTHGAYAASKAALATVTKTLAAELGPLGIRVNGIHPGFIWGPHVEKSMQDTAERSGTSFADVKAAVEAQTCLRYLPSSDEIAGAVVFFASDLARAVTGQALPVNAGHWFH